MFEREYRDSLQRLIDEGRVEHNRTGVDTLAIQHQYFMIPTPDKAFPILRGKKVYPKMALKELVWMLEGRTDVEWLHRHKVTYWDEWVLADGTIGRAYGYQFRNFNGVDQLEQLIDGLTVEPMSRRHIISLWNQSDLGKMALPPCMYDYHWCCDELGGDRYRVNLHCHARSNDSFLGAPYNFMFEGWFMYMVVQYLNKYAVTENTYEVGDMHYTADNYHLYVNHIDAARQYIANVDEDHDGVVSGNSTEIYISDEMLDARDIRSFDDYLLAIDENMSSPYIGTRNANTSTFVYPAIKADIAV